MQLADLDLAIVAVYILGMTLLGVWFARAQKDLRTYFVGGRNVGWFMVLISIVATETSAVTFLSVPGVAYNPEGGNLTFLQLSFGFIIGRCLIAWFLLPSPRHHVGVVPGLVVQVEQVILVGLLDVGQDDRLWACVV